MRLIIKNLWRGKIIGDKIFDNVFEAIRHFERNNPVLKLLNGKKGHLIRNNTFNLIDLPDGTIGAFPPNLGLKFYRGENKDFEGPCVPSIYRIRKPEEKDTTGKRHYDFILLDSLRIKEFELTAWKFPQVKYAIKDFCNVDFKALAQHYELNTDFLDLSSDIVTAAFFATHSYDIYNGFQIKQDGLGCIRFYIAIELLNLSNTDSKNFRLIGLQPFQRPGIQCAFAIRLSKEEDFSQLSGKLLFKQDEKYNSLLNNVFCKNNGNILFPKEQISDVAQKIKNSNKISNMAIKSFCEENGYDFEFVEKILKKHNIQISERLIFHLSRQQRKKMENNFDGKPYGDVKFKSRIATK